jgi:hypothetical protein
MHDRPLYSTDPHGHERPSPQIQAFIDPTTSTFTLLRQACDAPLDMPNLILPSVQVNIRAGHLPPAESDGHHYLKLPINVF